MRVLLLTHSFNSLSQRLYAELVEDGHAVSVELDIADSVTEEAVALFRPDLVVAPFLKRAVPASVWARELVLIVHPGIVGDRGPSALDWAIMNEEREWGVTVLQAEAEMDAGPVWASVGFPMRAASKASLYRNEVTEAALVAVREAIARVSDWRAGRWQPTPLAAFGDTRGRSRPLLRQPDRAIDWHHEPTARVIARIRAADGFPGVADELFGYPCHLFDAWPAVIDRPPGVPGELVARRGGALLRATCDGAVWIGHVKRADAQHAFKLPATEAFAAEAARLPEWATETLFAAAGERPVVDDQSELRYRESADGRVGYLVFEFYNGAMSTAQCAALTSALREVAKRPSRVLVLEGGGDFWSNGIHLNTIEAADSPAEESWRNINAIDDACVAILTMTDKITVAAVRGNAGAGGCFLALAADEVWLRDGVILNPHYRNMGNLFGSEYWTYLLPRRVGAEAAAAIMHNRLPLLARKAVASGFADAVLDGGRDAFAREFDQRAQALAADPALAQRLAHKAAGRAADEAKRPLADYRAAELAHMRRNFYGFDPSYHVARYHFVLKSPHSWTPRHLARHRDLGWLVPQRTGVERESVTTTA